MVRITRTNASRFYNDIKLWHFLLQKSEGKSRSGFMVIIRKMIQERGLSQTEAAKLLSTTQTRISEIVNGKIANHSVDKLFTMLHILGWDFQFDYAGGVVTVTAEQAGEVA